MITLDKQIMYVYFKLEEAERQRIRFERIFHPENLDWKEGKPPPITETKEIRKGALVELGFNEEFYQRMVEEEKKAKEDLYDLVYDHPLWPHFDLIRGLSLRMCGSFVAAGGDITRPNTPSSFWSGMGLGMKPDGTVPRRVRGVKAQQMREQGLKTIPCLPHVSKVGEQIRQQIVRSGGSLRELYIYYRSIYNVKYPARPKMFNYRAALRATQKVFYAACWAEWRTAYNLPAPKPYAFAILEHEGIPVNIRDFHDYEYVNGRKVIISKDSKKEKQLNE